MERKAFNFYKSYYDVVLELPENDRLPFLMAILTMQFEGVEPTNLSGVAKIAFLGQKHSIIKQIEGFKAGKKTDNKNKPNRDTDSDPDRQPDSHPDNKNKDKNKNKGNKPKVNSKNVIPTFDEFIEYAKTIDEIYKSTLDYSIKSKYQSWVDNGWKDGNGNDIKNWKNTLRNTLPYLREVFKLEQPQETDKEYARRIWKERNLGI